MLLSLLLSESLLVDELFVVHGESSLLVLDNIVHLGLSEHGLISLVVSVTTVTDQIDNDILLELGPPIGSELTDESDGLGIVSIDVENGSVDSFGDIGRVRSGSTLSRVGSETDLVVENEMNRSSSSVMRKIVESHSFVNDTLTSESSVTVEEETHRSASVGVSFEVLKRLGLSENDTIFGFEMGRVGDEREGDSLSTGSRSNVVGTEMVLDIGGSLLIGILRRSEFGENGFGRFSDDVGEDVETTTMGHTDND